MRTIIYKPEIFESEKFRHTWPLGKFPYILLSESQWQFEKCLEECCWCFVSKSGWLVSCAGLISMINFQTEKYWTHLGNKRVLPEWTGVLECNSSLRASRSIDEHVPQCSFQRAHVAEQMLVATSNEWILQKFSYIHVQFATSRDECRTKYLNISA